MDRPHVAVIYPASGLAIFSDCAAANGRYVGLNLSFASGFGLDVVCRWGGSPLLWSAVAVRKDDALAAHQAALVKVAYRVTFSSGGGLIHTTAG